MPRFLAGSKDQFIIHDELYQGDTPFHGVLRFFKRQGRDGASLLYSQAGFAPPPLNLAQFISQARFFH